jgi:Uma2 family endonuclease
MSEPEPDVVLLKPKPDFYRNDFPSGADALLVIEVSDSWLHYDRDVKVSLYARHGIPEIWIVDLQNDALLVYGSLSDGAYGRQTSAGRPAFVRRRRLREPASTAPSRRRSAR